MFSSTGGRYAIDLFFQRPYPFRHRRRVSGERWRVSAMKNVMLFWALIGSAIAQIPTGSIAGMVRDPAGAPVSGARLKAVNLATNLVRIGASSDQGDYSFPSLPAGEYEVTVEANGFPRTTRTASVEAGATTTTDFALRLGEVKESVTVDEASPQIQYDSHSVGGVIT